MLQPSEEEIKLYEKLNDVSNADRWDNTKKNSSLIHFAEKNNISYLVIEKDNDVHTNVHDKNMLKNQGRFPYALLTFDS